ncbi:MAG: hypothetical protein K8T91_07695 [Planctomycetes bacterium]|nr:hypothetical protein [Planctomycetota bacterium]
MRTCLFLLMMVFLMLVTGVIHAAPPATQPTVGLNKLVGQSITLTGTYGGPGKFADYITLNATEWVYFKGKLSGLPPTFGQQIQATGTLRYDPGFSPPPNGGGIPVDGIPAHYFFESAVISAATQPTSKPDYASFVHVAVIDPKQAVPVQKLLESNGIPNVIEGSVAYGVSVSPKDRDRAITLLKADAAQRGYWMQTPTTQPTTIPFDTHNGYFVSNKFEPQAPASFVVLRDQKAFDEVFGAGFVMNDKSHRLPADAFDAKIVVAAIKRGKVVVEFKVGDVTLDADVLIVRYTTTSTKQDSAEFACPLIVSVPKGDYTAVDFVEDGKSVKKIEVKQAASQPAAAFDIRCNKKGDSVAVTTEADRTIFAVTSPSGIGGATIERRADSWPKQVVLTKKLRRCSNSALRLPSPPSRLEGLVVFATADMASRFFLLRPA